MKICFNTATSGASHRLEDVLDALGRAGYDGIEIDTGRLDDALTRFSVDELKERIRRNRLEVAAVMAFALVVFDDRSEQLARIARYAELGQRLGSSVLLTYCGGDIPEGMSKAEALAKAGEAAMQYADAACAFGGQIALEPIGRSTLMGGPREALEIARRSGRANVGIMMDTFHYYRSEVPVSDIAAIPVEKLLIVHVNDSENRPIEQLNDGHRLYPGEGCLPLREDLAALRKIGYTGHLSIEIFREEYRKRPIDSIVQDAKRGVEGVLGRVIR
ncbi:MAG: sugar phosphate isomerase/epimerase [Firmicutes bacterium]|nr:sugar phosphate isomerase/epimerase [Bacillota bacterium]